MAGREPVPRETLVVTFAQLVIDGLRTHPVSRPARRRTTPGSPRRSGGSTSR
jgi:hypothetical protein